MVFRFKCYNLPIFGWCDGNDICGQILPVLIFFQVILYILLQYVQNYRPLPHPHLY